MYWHEHFEAEAKTLCTFFAYRERLAGREPTANRILAMLTTDSTPLATHFDNATKSPAFQGHYASLGTYLLQLRQLSPKEFGGVLTVAIRRLRNQEIDLSIE